MVGRHILVWGPASSGKTTLAKFIAQRLGVPYVELDAVFWQADWVEKPEEDFRADVLAFLDSHPEGWVIDGNYYGRLKDMALPQADTVVWLRLPLRTVFGRVFRRTVGRIMSREPLWGNNYETWGKAFFSRDSLLLYVLKNWRRHVRKTRQEIAAIPHRAEIIELRSQREVADFVANLEATK